MILRCVFLLVVFFVLGSCEKEDDDAIDEVVTNLMPLDDMAVIDCIDPTFVPADTLNCEEANLLNACAIQSLGRFKLSDFSKSVIRKYCIQQDQYIVFRSEHGDKIRWQLIDKQYSNFRAFRKSNEPCPLNLNEQLHYCINTEELSLTWVWEQKELQIIVELENHFDLEYGGPNIYDRLIIKHKIPGNSPFLVKFSAIIDFRDSNAEQVNFTSFFEDFSLLNEPFEEVYFYDIQHDLSINHRYFYSRKLGIIGFIDEDGVTWKLE